MNKKLIIYYSFSNNTDSIANKIHKSIDADIERINMVKPYTGSYNDVVNQGKREIESGYMPQIKPLSVNLSEYNTIILGTPVWWYTFAPAINTFLSNNDLSGKRVIPFITNGGWIGHALKDIQDSCSGAKVESEINLKFNGDRLVTSEKELELWIAKLDK